MSEGNACKTQNVQPKLINNYKIEYMGTMVSHLLIRLCIIQQALSNHGILIFKTGIAM